MKSATAARKICIGVVTKKIEVKSLRNTQRPHKLGVTRHLPQGNGLPWYSLVQMRLWALPSPFLFSPLFPLVLTTAMPHSGLFRLASRMLLMIDGWAEIQEKVEALQAAPNLEHRYYTAHHTYI